MAYEIPLFDVNFDDREVEAVASTVRSGWISMGQNVERFETEVAGRLGVQHVVAVSNCTGALHLALVAMGVGPGDEVIVPSMTFVATANAVRYTGAEPVFADIVGIDEPNIDPEDAERKVGPRTRAIIPMHFGGFACRMDALLEIARQNGLKVIEDAAHAIDTPGVRRKPGTLGDVGCFSLFANKVITSGEGGFIATDDPDTAARIKLLRSHGMTTASYDRARGHATAYDVVEIGFNYRLDDIRAALALAQLEKLDGILERRATLRRRYLELLRPITEIVVPFNQFDVPSANYIFPVVLKDGGAERRERVREHLKTAGIQTSVHYPAVHRFAVYGFGKNLERTEEFADHEITLPFFDRLGDDQMDRVVSELAAALRAN